MRTRAVRSLHLVSATSSTRSRSTCAAATAARARCRSGARRTCPKGGPDGGDGGSGGDVCLQADRNVASLLAFRDHPHRRAESGKHGVGQASGTARAAPTSSSTSPRARVVQTRDGELLADLVRHGDRYLAARGGRGGRGNARFLSNARRAPSFAEQGEYGEEHWLRLELKLLADAALVGLPERREVDADLGGQRGEAEDRRLPVHHARAAPRRRALPRPRVRARRHPRAHRGRGRGPRARPPVPPPRRAGARARAPARPRAASTSRTPEEQERVLLDELGRYRPELLERPRLVVGSKADVATSSSTIPTGCASRRSPVPGSTSSSAASARSSTRRAPRSPTPRAVRRAAAGRGGVLRRARRRRRVARHRAAPPSASSRWPTSPTPRRSRTCSSGCAGWASSARSRARARARATSCASAPVELDYDEGIG